MSHTSGVLLKRCKGLFYIYATSCLLVLTIGCRPLLPKSRPNTANGGSWSLIDISRWFSGRRAGLKQVTAWADISCVSKGAEKSFDVFFSLDHKGEGRVEGLGPWRSPIFYLVFDPNSVYFYLPNEAKLYLGLNHPDHVQRLTGLPLDLSLLFNLMASILPEDLSPCSPYVAEEERFQVLCLEGEDHDMIWKAGILIKDFPVVEELTCNGDDTHKNFRVRYVDTINLDGYPFPQNIHFSWPGGQEWHIKVKSVRLNRQVPEAAALPDESWFRGEVIYLE